jgi:hypothetical protein
MSDERRSYEIIPSCFPNPGLILPGRRLEQNVHEWAKFDLDCCMEANEFDLYDFHQYFTCKESGRCFARAFHAREESTATIQNSHMNLSLDSP